MQVTGNMIMRRIKRLRERADRKLKTYEASLTFLSTDSLKEKPQEIIDKYEAIERKIAALQELQSHYNLAVTVVVQGERLTLEQVAKLKGTVNTIASKWNAAVNTDPTALTRYELMAMRQGETSVEIPQRVVPMKEAETQYEAAKDRVDAFSDAIMAGNSIALDLTVLENLFGD